MRLAEKLMLSKLPSVGLRLNACKLDSMLAFQWLPPLPMLSTMWQICVPLNNLKRINAGGGLLRQPMDMINRLQTISRIPGFARAESGFTATIY